MKLRKLFSKIPKKLLVAATTLATAVVLALPAIAIAGFGPERPTYDYNKYDQTKSCTDPSQANGRCGSMDGPVFNSFVNTPSYGDERNFTRIAEVVAGQSPVQADFRETSTATPGKTYWVRTFVHNNANEATNGANFDGTGVAKNTRVRVAIPSGTAGDVDVTSYITASNAKPDRIWDTATLANGNQAFSVNYVPGSAKLYNGVFQGGTPLSDAIISDQGTLVGYNQMNGVVPGYFDYSAYVYVQVEVKAPTSPGSTTLPVTGPGDVAAIFAAVSVASMVAYRVFVTRRLNG